MNTLILEAVTEVLNSEFGGDKTALVMARIQGRNKEIMEAKTKPLKGGSNANSSNCEIFYTHHGKECFCRASHKGSPDDLAWKFHATMQNAIEGNKYGGILVGRYGKGEYRLIAIHRAGIWYDQLAGMPTPLVSGTKPFDSLFSEPKDRAFPDRLKGVA